VRRSVSERRPATSGRGRRAAGGWIEPARARRSRATRGETPVAEGLPSRADDHRARSGQSLIETCLAVGLIGLLFMGMLQVALLFTAQDVLYQAAAAGARAKTVGMNRWMVLKCVRLGSIPNAGKMLEPQFTNVDQNLRDMRALNARPGDMWDAAIGARPSSAQYPKELEEFGFYLGAENQPRAQNILDYADWDTIRPTAGHTLATDADGRPADYGVLHVHVRQGYPLWAPMHRAFYAADSVGIGGEAELESHYPLYVDDRLW